MRARVRAIAACLFLAVAAGCKPEEHIISVTGGYSSLANFPGAKGGLKPESQVSDQEQMDRWTKLLAKNPKNVEGEAVEGRPLRRKMQDGKYILISRAPHELMQHLFETLRDQEYDLLEQEVLSQRTRSEYLARGKKPREAVEWLVRNQSDVEALLVSMPAGEQTPGVLMTPIGNNAFALSPSGAEVLDLKYKTLDVVIERGQFKLLMIR